RSEAKAPYGVNALALSPDGALVVVAARETYGARLHDAATGKKLRTYELPDWEIKAVAFAPDGKHLATGAADRVVVWETDSEDEVGSIPGPEVEVTALEFSGDGKSLTLVRKDGGVSRYDPATGKELEILRQPDDEPAKCYALSPDRKRLAGAVGGFIRVRDLA